MEHNVAYIKNGIVKNILVFEDVSDISLLESFKSIYDATDFVICENKTAFVGGLWNGEKFFPYRPFASWVLNEREDEYIPPFLPDGDPRGYEWNEATISWDQINPDYVADLYMG